MKMRFSGYVFGVCALAVVGCGVSATPLTSSDSGADSASDDASLLLSDASGRGNREGAVPSAEGSVTDAGGNGPSGDDGSAGPNGNDGAAASGNGDATTTPGCSAFGGHCTYGAQCCSGVCDTKSSTCAPSVTSCSPPAAACTANTDCCGGACLADHCGANQCLSIGSACPVQGNTCCTDHCGGGTCQPIAPNPSCTTAGNTCTAKGQCCSGLCDSAGRCALGSSYCIQTGDICYHANDCCGGLCSAPNGNPVTASNPGLCTQPTSGAVNCTGVDGSLCAGGSCGSCCSRLCAPYGSTGVSICQPARGCRVEGDLCRSNTDCCGAAGSGVLGDGSVVCSNSVNGGAVGVCMTPGPTAQGGTCVPEGDVCHFTQSTYACGVSSARSDCCGGQRPKFLACVLDPFGVPRCNAYTGAGDAGAGCLAAGNACSMASECCNGSPCVANASGQLVCSASACQQASQSCTTNADCCAGLPCVTLPGSVQGTCSPIAPPPTPPSSDGGSSPPPGDSGAPGTPGDGGAPTACALYGQSCASLACCTGTQCIGGVCSTF